MSLNQCTNGIAFSRYAVCFFSYLCFFFYKRRAYLNNRIFTLVYFSVKFKVLLLIMRLNSVAEF